MTTDPAYAQATEHVGYVRGLTRALTSLQEAAGETPQPATAEAALHHAISRALDDLDALLETYYHPYNNAGKS